LRVIIYDALIGHVEVLHSTRRSNTLDWWRNILPMAIRLGISGSRRDPSILQYMVMRLGGHWQNGMREWVLRTVFDLMGVGSRLSSTRCDEVSSIWERIDSRDSGLQVMYI